MTITTTPWANRSVYPHAQENHRFGNSHKYLLIFGIDPKTHSPCRLRLLFSLKLPSTNAHTYAEYLCSWLLILRFRILSLLECLSLSIFGDKNEWLRRAIALCSQLKQVVCWLLFHRTVQSSRINRDKFVKKNLFNKSSENEVSNDWMPNKSGRLKSPNKIKLQIIASENSVLKSHKMAKYLWIMRFLLTIRHPKCSNSLLIVAHWTNKWKKK